MPENNFLYIAAIAIFLILFFKPVVAGDGFGYHSILEGVLRDHTLNFENQTRYNGINQLNWIYYNDATGKYVSSKSFGLPLLATPLYSLSLLLDDFRIFHIKDDFFIRERRDILVHQASIPLTTLLLVAVSIALSILVIERHYYPGLGAISVCLAFFSSSMLRYATYDLSYTHGAEAGLMAILLWLFLSNSSAYTLGAVIGIMTAVRYTSVIFIVPLAGYYLYKNRRSDLAKLGIGVMPFLVLIILYWIVQFGSPFNSGDPGHAFYFSGLPINLFKILFDIDRGILYWTPGVLLSVIGLIFLKDDRRWVFLGFIISYYIVYAVYAGGWNSGDAFGNRWFVVFFPLFSLGIATIINQLPKIKPFLYFCAVYTLVLYLVFLAYPISSNYTEIINYWVTKGDISALPSMVAKKIGVVRLLLER